MFEAEALISGFCTWGLLRPCRSAVIGATSKPNLVALTTRSRMRAGASPNQFFVGERPVNLSHIKERHGAIRRPDECDHFPPVLDFLPLVEWSQPYSAVAPAVAPTLAPPVLMLLKTAGDASTVEQGSWFGAVGCADSVEGLGFLRLQEGENS